MTLPPTIYLVLCLSLGLPAATTAQECSFALGLESYDIEDYQLSAAKFHEDSSGFFPAWNARLNHPSSRNGKELGWFYTPVNYWLQIDLLVEHRVTGLALQGHPSYDVHVTKLKLMTSQDTYTWQWYTDSSDNARILPENRALQWNHQNPAGTTEYVSISPEIQTRGIRVIPTAVAHSGHFRLELYGCTVAPNISQELKITHPATSLSVSLSGERLILNMSHVYAATAVTIRADSIDSGNYNINTSVLVEYSKLSDGTEWKAVPVYQYSISGAEVTLQFAFAVKGAVLNVTCLPAVLRCRDVTVLYGHTLNSCPPDFVEVGESCLKYYDMSQSMNNDMERGICLRMSWGGSRINMAVMDNLHELAFIKMVNIRVHQILAVYSHLFIVFQQGFYISAGQAFTGLFRDTSSSSVKWIDQVGQEVTDIPFHSAASSGYDCTAVKDLIKVRLCYNAAAFVCKTNIQGPPQFPGCEFTTYTRNKKLETTEKVTLAGREWIECMFDCQHFTNFSCASIEWTSATKLCVINKHHSDSREVSRVSASGTRIVDYFCLEDPACNEPLLFQNSTQQNVSLSASSSNGADFTPEKIRLEPIHYDGYTLYWAAQVKQDAWFQVEFATLVKVQKILFTGAMFNNQGFTKSFMLAYSNDTVLWCVYGSGENKLFPGLLTKTDLNKIILVPSVVAKSVRVYPRTYDNRPALRMEFYGCVLDQPVLPVYWPYSSLGMGNHSYTDIDHYQLSGPFVSSGTYNPPWQARGENDPGGLLGTEQTVWCTTSPNMWFKVDLLTLHRVVGMTMTGGLVTSQYTTAVNIRTSTEVVPLEWTTFTDHTGKEMVFGGQIVYNHTVYVKFPNITDTRHLLVILTETGSTTVCQRLEFYGQPTLTSDTPIVTSSDYSESRDALGLCDCWLSQNTNYSLLCQNTTARELMLTFNSMHFLHGFDIQFEGANNNAINWVKQFMFEYYHPVNSTWNPVYFTVQQYSPTVIRIHNVRIIKVGRLRVTTPAKNKLCAGLHVYGYQAEVCPPGSVEFDGSCYKYLPIEMTMSAPEQRSICQRMAWSEHGTFLAAPKTLLEWDFIKDLTIRKKSWVGLFKAGSQWQDETGTNVSAPYFWESTNAHLCAAINNMVVPITCTNKRTIVCKTRVQGSPESNGCTWELQRDKTLSTPDPHLVPHTADLTQCMAACQHNASCRSVEWAYLTLECYISGYNSWSAEVTLVTKYNTDLYEYSCTAERTCLEPLMFKDNVKQDVVLTSTTPLNGRTVDDVRLGNIDYPDNGICWRPHTGADSWFQVEFGSVYKVQLLVMAAGMYRADNYVKHFMLLYSNHSGFWEVYTDSTGQQVLTGPYSRYGVSKQTFVPALVTRLLRIDITSWWYHINLKFEVYGCRVLEPATSPYWPYNALGMGSYSEHDIYHYQLTGRYQDGTKYYPPWQARIGNNPEVVYGQEAAFWRAGSPMWLQVDFLIPHTIAGMAMDGGSSSTKWYTKTFNLLHSMTGHENWTTVVDGATNQTVFTGQSAFHRGVYIAITPVITARYIRFVPLTWVNGVCQRFEFYGQPKINVDDVIRKNAITSQEGATSCSCSLVDKSGQVTLCLDGQPGTHTFRYNTTYLIQSIDIKWESREMATDVLNATQVLYLCARNNTWTPLWNTVYELQTKWSRHQVHRVSHAKGIRVIFAAYKPKCAQLKVYGSPALVCPPGFVEFKGHCYKHYYTNHVNMNTAHQRSFCNRMSWGGQPMSVAVPTTHSELQMLRNFGKVNQYMYIGLFRDNTSTPWTDDAGNVVEDFPFWQTSPTALCARFLATYYLNSIHCTIASQIICKAKPSGTPEHSGCDWLPHVRRRLSNTDKKVIADRDLTQCMADCQSETSFRCLSIEWKHSTYQCHLNRYHAGDNGTTRRVEAGVTLYEYRCVQDASCNEALIFANNTLQDVVLTASSVRSDPYKVESSNIELLGSGWMSKSYYTIKGWLQVEFGYVAVVQRIVLLGGNTRWNGYTKQVYLLYSNNSDYWDIYRDTEQQYKLFDTVLTRYDLSTLILSPVVVAKYLRIHQHTYSYAPAMKMEIYGCNTTEQSIYRHWPYNSLGMDNSTHHDIQDYQLSGKSTSLHPVWNARIGNDPKITLGAEKLVWQGTNVLSWILVDLLTVHKVAGMVISGGDVSAYYPRSFTLHTSNTTVSELSPVLDGTNTQKVFPGLFLYHAGMYTSFNHTLEARYLKVTVTSVHSTMASYQRLEFYGQPLMDGSGLLSYGSVTSLTRQPPEVCSCQMSVNTQTFVLCMDTVPTSLRLLLHGMYFIHGFQIKWETMPGAQFIGGIGAKYLQPRGLVESDLVFTIEKDENQTRFQLKRMRHSAGLVIYLPAHTTQGCATLTITAHRAAACPPGFVEFSGYCYQYQSRNKLKLSDDYQKSTCERMSWAEHTASMAYPASLEELYFMKSLSSRFGDTHTGVFKQSTSEPWRYSNGTNFTSATFAFEDLSTPGYYLCTVLRPSAMIFNTDCARIYPFTCKVKAQGPVKTPNCFWQYKKKHRLVSTRTARGRRVLSERDLTQCLSDCQTEQEFTCTAVEWLPATEECRVSQYNSASENVTEVADNNVDLYEYQCPTDTDCLEPLLFKNSSRQNVTFSASSTHTNSDLENIILDSVDFPGGGNIWWPAYYTNAWFEVHFEYLVKIQKLLVIGGLYRYNMFVTSFYVWYTNNTDSWNVAQDGDGNDKLYSGLTNRYDISQHLFDPILYTFYFRVVIKAFINAPMMRMELYGCQTDYQNISHTIYQVPCAPLLLPPNGKWTGDCSGNSTLYYEQTCELACIPGFSLITPVTVHCDGYGQWNHTNVTACQVIEDNCGPPPNVSFTSISQDSEYFYPGDEAMFMCNTGYYLPGKISSFNATCTENSTWTNVPTACEPINCGASPSVQHGTIAELTGSVYLNTTTYTCDTGYVLSNGSDISTCMEDGKWSNVSHCIPVDCGPPVTPLYSSVIKITGTVYGNTAVVTCDEGHYYSSGHQTNTSLCTATGNWSHVGQCQVKDCGPAPLSVNASITYTTGSTYNHTTMYTCRSGLLYLTETDNVTSRCLANGTWSYVGRCYDEPTILRIKNYAALSVTPKPVYKPPVTNKVLLCPRPQVFHNCKMMESNRFLGGWVVYQCRAGYRFSDGGDKRTLLCIGNGPFAVWHATIKDCQAKYCTAPNPPLENSTCTHTAGVRAGSEVTCTCAGDLRFRSGHKTASMVCELTGEWSQHPGSCLERCPGLTFVNNGNVNLSTYDNIPGSKVKVECSRGHRFPDGSSEKWVSCLHDGTWEAIEHCQIDTCHSLDYVGHSTTNTSLTVYDTSVTITCLPGFTFTPERWTKVVRCQEFNRWSQPNITDCVAVFCPPLPVVLNAVHMQYGNGAAYGTIINITCHTRHGVAGSNGSVLRLENGLTQDTVTCLQSGNWSTHFITCDDGRCPPVPIILHSVPNTQNAKQGTLVTYTAEDGYIFNNSSKTYSIYCDTQWNISDQVDIKVLKCPDIPVVGNATVTYISTGYMAEGNITCDRGFIVGDGNTALKVQCRGDQQWHVIYPNNVTAIPDTCENMKCGGLPAIPNAKYSTQYSKRYDSVVQVRCKPGHWFRRGEYTAQVTCSYEQTWLPTLTGCTEIRCPTVAVWNGLVADNNSTSVKARINANCGQNALGQKLEFDGLSEQTVQSVCSYTGEWVPPIPQCFVSARLARDNIPPTEASQSQLLGATLGVTLAAITVFIVVTDAVTIWRTFWTIHNLTQFSSMKRLKKNKVDISEKNTTGVD